jgi:hypothetical protein
MRRLRVCAATIKVNIAQTIETRIVSAKNGKAKKMFEIGEVVKRKDSSGIYVVASLPWTVGECELIKLAPIPEDGLYLIDAVQGGVKTELIERMI